ncbi:hypothetical protein VNO78_25651 [Psophocarpus tetragonolobus]|uniref:Uncharacterized protein n=1 Tax=Psophocarpus tetragonolobus TaxID=3891 RepID=A0AAN9S6W2_PSOTE
MIMDVFQCLLKKISTLGFLVLGQNKFYGRLGCPNINGTWNILQIMDIAINNFSGELPGNYFRTSKAMMSRENQDESKIPTGTQLQSFPASSYEGNKGLYGSPLTEKLDPKMQVAKYEMLACTIDWNFTHVELGLILAMELFLVHS